MTPKEPAVVVTYTEFVDRRERRLRVAAAISRENAARTIDAEAVAVAAVAPMNPSPLEGSATKTP